MAMDLLVGAITLFSAVLFVIGILSYKRTKARKVLFITVGFGLFLLKGLVTAIGLYTPLIADFVIPNSAVIPFDILLALDLGILVILYLALFKK